VQFFFGADELDYAVFEQNTAEFKNLMSLRGPIFKAAATFNKFQT